MIPWWVAVITFVAGELTTFFFVALCNGDRNERRNV